jgi:SNF2 family DNA or RNA helicase
VGARSGSDESIVEASGKMETSARLLRRLKAKGHCLVVFSQFTRFLDVDDFFHFVGYSFVRLDGSTNRVQVRHVCVCVCVCGCVLV